MIVQFNIAGHDPVPRFTFERVEFHKDVDCYQCRFTVAGCDVANIRIPALTIEHVVAAMAEAARAAYVYQRPDMEVTDFTMTVNKGT